jgi:hypothetical protein
MKPESKIPVSALRAQAAAMVANGTMPSLETVLQAIAQTRAKYVPLILEARKDNS